MAFAHLANRWTVRRRSRAPARPVVNEAIVVPFGPVPGNPGEPSKSEAGGVRPGPVCGVCPYFHSCVAICDVIESLLPSMERARVDHEDLVSLHMGIRLTHAILDHEHILTPKQREIVRLYYRESLLQEQIAERLGVTQQAIHDSLQRARANIGRHVRELASREFDATTVEAARDSSEIATARSANASRSTTHRR